MSGGCLRNPLTAASAKSLSNFSCVPDTLANFAMVSTLWLAEAKNQNTNFYNGSRSFESPARRDPCFLPHSIMTTQKLKAVSDLRDCDHCFISKEGVEHFCEAFSIEPKTIRRKCDPPGTFKGLTFYDDDGKPLPAGSEREGMDADMLAEYICDELNVEYKQFHGRGSQLRHCCDMLEKHFGKSPVAA